jgi:3-oxoacyl-[acyl-carrier-protein] synthase II
MITGLGAVTPIGQGADGVWEGVRAGRSAGRRVGCFDASGFRSQVAAEIPDFDPAAALGGNAHRRLDRFSQLALASTQQAWEHARLGAAHLDLERVGVSLGSALGGIAKAEEQCRVFQDRGLRRVDPALALCVFVGAGPCNIAIEFGLTGPATGNGNSCASGTVAIGDALRMLQHDEADVMLAVGAEAPLAPLCYGAFSILRAMSARNEAPEAASRPFDKDRDGFVMAEGAATLVLEEREHARARGATMYGEVLGYALTNDGYHMTAPRPDGRSAARAMRLALRDAGLPPEAVDHVNAHGSSTPLSDAVESQALAAVFGEQARRLPVSGTKGLHGHPLGAAGAIEALISTLVLQHDFLPPTANLECPGEGCELDYVGPHGRPQRVNTILSNSFGFGGINASLVIGRAS